MRLPEMNEMQQGTETVLVVEDEGAVRELAVYILRRQGYTVLEASDGRKALQLTQDHRGEIHLLLTDTVMPHMNGTSLANQFRSLRPKTKIILMSGYADETIINETKQTGPIAFIPKPFSATELVHKVRSVLNS